MRLQPILCVVVTFLLVGCATLEEKFDERKLDGNLSALPTANANVIWAKKLVDDSVDRFAKLEPIVDGDSVLAADRDGRIQRINIQTGTTIWSNQISTSFTAGPAITDKFVTVGSRDSRLFLFNKQTGVLIWEKNLSSEILAPAVFARGFVVIQTNDGKIVALRESDGELVWSFERSVPILTIRGTSSPVVSGDKVIAGFANGKVVALNLFDGKLLWEAAASVPKGRSELERIVDVDGDLYVLDGIVYAVSYHGKLVALNVESGRILWSRDISSYSGIESDGNYLFIVDDSARIWAFDKASGATVWAQDRFVGRLTTRALVQKDKIIVGDRLGNIYWLAKNDGRVISRLEYDFVVYTSGILNPAKVVYEKNAFETAAIDIDQSVANIALEIANDGFFIKYRSGVFALIRHV